MSDTDWWRQVPDINGNRGEPMPTSVIWLDPGLMTGFMRWWPEYNEFHSAEVNMCELGDGLDAALDVNTWIGWEAFVIQPGSSRLSQDGSSLEVIGIAKYMAYHRVARVLHPTLRSDKKLGLKHIKAVGWRKPGMDHANDAAAHMLGWALKRHVLPSYIIEKLPVGTAT
jgi:hypothetical protein